MKATVADAIRTFVVESFLYDESQESTIANDTDLIERGVVDSFGVHEIVGFLEATFSIKVEDADITPENLGSICAMVRYVLGKKTAFKEIA